jgi:octaprenyl-diphosphate synthase
LLQIHNRNNLDLDEATYIQIITRKTASLCAACCMLGARYSGASEARIRQLETYGLSVGIAFQIQDDILDLVGDPETVGKTLGLDLEKGKMTLPLIHFLNNAPTQHRELLKSLLSGNEPDRLDSVRNLILPGPSIDYARARAANYIARARAALRTLPESDATAMLDAMAEFVVSRPL